MSEKPDAAKMAKFNIPVSVPTEEQVEEDIYQESHEAIHFNDLQGDSIDASNLTTLNKTQPVNRSRYSAGKFKTVKEQTDLLNENIVSCTPAELEVVDEGKLPDDETERFTHRTVALQEEELKHDTYCPSNAAMATIDKLVRRDTDNDDHIDTRSEGITVRKDRTQDPVIRAANLSNLGYVEEDFEQGERHAISIVEEQKVHYETQARNTSMQTPQKFSNEPLDKRGWNDYHEQSVSRVDEETKIADCDEPGRGFDLHNTTVIANTSINHGRHLKNFEAKNIATGATAL